MLLLLLLIVLVQQQSADPAMAERIQQLFHTFLTVDDDTQIEAAEAETKSILRKNGLPVTAAVGEDAAYKFVLLTCSSGDSPFQNRVLRLARQRAMNHEIPPDAMTYCAAHVRLEKVKANAMKLAPRDPALRDWIEQLFSSDQAVRKRGDNIAEALQTDREHTAALEDIFTKHGVPAYRMVGPRAAADFVVMIQHQSAQFREKVLPGLKANVDAGQADPGSYAMVLDRSRTDAGMKQLYGENLICDSEHPGLHVGPIDDQDRVDARRSAIGLMRLSLYAQFVIANSPDVCSAQ